MNAEDPDALPQRGTGSRESLGFPIHHRGARTGRISARRRRLEHFLFAASGGRSCRSIPFPCSGSATSPGVIVAAVLVGIAHLANGWIVGLLSGASPSQAKNAAPARHRLRRRRGHPTCSASVRGERGVISTELARALRDSGWSGELPRAGTASRIDRVEAERGGLHPQRHDRRGARVLEPARSSASTAPPTWAPRLGRAGGRAVVARTSTICGMRWARPPPPCGSITGRGRSPPSSTGSCATSRMMSPRTPTPAPCSCCSTRASS